MSVGLEAVHLGPCDTPQWREGSVAKLDCERRWRPEVVLDNHAFAALGGGGVLSAPYRPRHVDVATEELLGGGGPKKRQQRWRQQRRRRGWERSRLGRLALGREYCRALPGRSSTRNGGGGSWSRGGRGGCNARATRMHICENVLRVRGAGCALRSSRAPPRIVSSSVVAETGGCAAAESAEAATCTDRRCWVDWEGWEGA